MADITCRGNDDLVTATPSVDSRSKFTVSHRSSWASNARMPQPGNGLASTFRFFEILHVQMSAVPQSGFDAVYARLLQALFPEGRLLGDKRF